MKLYNKFCKKHGLIAQLVEQLTLNQLVVGSSPTGPNLKKIAFKAIFLCLNLHIQQSGQTFVCPHDIYKPYTYYFVLFN